MSELKVKIVQLDRMRVISTYGFGPEPEGIAWEKLLSWAKEKGLNLSEHRFFGFNNPNPSPGSPNYGYEQWMTVGTDVEPEGDLRVQDFEGGLFAVARCEGVENIGRTWKELVHWHEDSKYKKPNNWFLCLEECVSPADGPIEELVLDLYLPIVE